MDPRKKSLIFLSLFIALSALGCQMAPTGRQQLALVSERKVRRESAAVLERVQKTAELDKNQDRVDYVKCIAKSLVSASKSPLNWQVHVFDSEEVKAFALPGGRIGIHSGLLQVADTPAQLAAVIAHEMAHVLSNHAREKMSYQTLSSEPLSYVAEVTQAEKAPLIQQAFRGLDLGLKVALHYPFSRLQETEADILGMELMARAGFDPEEAINFWKKMKAVDKKKTPFWLSSHPTHGDRVRHLKPHLRAAQVLFEESKARGQFTVLRCDTTAGVALRNPR